MTIPSLPLLFRLVSPHWLIRRMGIPVRDISWSGCSRMVPVTSKPSLHIWLCLLQHPNSKAGGRDRVSFTLLVLDKCTYHPQFSFSSISAAQGLHAASAALLLLLSQHPWRP